MVEIYNYSCPHRLLKDRWLEKKKNNPAFSIRSWARHLGFKNNAPLSLMLKGSRPIPKKYLPQFIESLELSPKEGRFLEALIDLKRAADPKTKEFYLKRLKEIEPTAKPDMTEVDTFRYFGNPIHTIILEMTELPDFKTSIVWIQERLDFRFRRSEIKDAIELLLNLALLKKDSNGRLIKTHKNITNKADVADLGSQEYHRNVSALAMKAVQEQDVNEREFNSYSFNIKSKDLPKAKKMIRQFIKDFISEIEAPPKKGQETYQLNSQFFRLTQPKRSR